MLLHDLRLAWLSIRRNPILAALMISAIAAGIGASMIAITLYHAKSGNPIWWKNDRLFAVAVDNRPDDPEYDKGQPHPEYPPFLMTYRDARAIYESAVPERSVMMFASRVIVDPGRKDLKAFRAMTRVTTADFFAMFDVPFLHGTGWSRSDDATPEPVVVISRKINEKLFGGANSMGRSITLDGHAYRVAGVIDTWMPHPKFYDLTSSFSPSEDIFMPFGWAVALELSTAGSMWCMSDKVTLSSFADVLAADCPDAGEIPGRRAHHGIAPGIGCNTR